MQLSIVNPDTSIKSKSLIELFELNVKLFSNKIAIFHREETISYHDLNCQANIMANYLMELGIKQGDVVTILLERSINLIVSVLGVLKTGAAYVIIDPDYPLSRIEYILKDTNSDFLITDISYKNKPKYKDLMKLHKCNYIDISHVLLNAKSYKMNPMIQSTENSLACIIYTSGSSGKPKGVLLSNKTFFRLFNGPNMVQISSSDCVAQISNASFDAAVYEMWAALGRGGSLVLIDNDTVLSPQALEECFKNYNVTTALLTTGLFNQLAKIKPSIFKLFKNVLFGGEAANPAIVRQIISNVELKPQRLFNLYGPTECGIVATYYEITKLDEDLTFVPIGVPVNNTQVYILNDSLEKVQPGEVGELYISGDGVAKGYLNLPDLTAESFISCPFDLDCKMYKTGDLAKSHPGGIIEFIGRKDNQVKVRGFRIELEEVESAMEFHPDIFQAVVLAPHLAQGHQHLVAFFTSKNSKNKINLRSIRSNLKKTLPDYMIPSIIMELDSLPLNAHGKIDRQALLNIPLNQEVENDDTFKNLTMVESLLLEVWKNLLGIDNIQLNDNFFNLGGDSIIIMKMIAEAAENGMRLKHSLILQHPTIESLARLVEDKETGLREEFRINTYPDLITITVENCNGNEKDLNDNIDLSLVQYSSEGLYKVLPEIEDVQAVYPLTSIQEGFLFHAMHDSKSYAYFVQTYWYSKKQYNSEAMIKAWDMLINNHELLRASYLWEELSEPMQIIYKEAKIVFLEKDWRMFLLEEQNLKLKEYLMEDRELGIDFKKKPLMRFTIIRLSEYEQIMIWSFHHIIMDGPSLFNIIEELDYYYSTLCSGQFPVSLRSALFKDYLVWQKKQNQEINKLFWENYLDGFTSSNQFLFQQHSRLDPLAGYSSHMPLNYYLPQALSQALNEYAKNNHLTINVVMQGLWAYLLSIYCDNLDVVFGLTVSIRPAGIKNVNRIVGPLIDTLPFRVRIDKNASLLEYFKKLQGNLAVVMDHNFYPYINIRKGAAMSLGHALFNSSFGFENKKGDANFSSFYDINFNTMTHYPLSVYIVSGEYIELKVNFDAHLYSGSIIDMLIKDYLQLLSDLTKKTNTSLKELSCFCFNEFKQKISNCNLFSLQCLDKNRFINIIEKQDHYKQEFSQTSRLPRNELEQKIADIWSDLLHTVVSIDDNFFEAGGDSLIAIRLVSRLRKELQMEIKIRNIFDSPTIAKLSELYKFDLDYMTKKREAFLKA